MTFWEAVKAAYAWCKAHLVLLGSLLLVAIGFLVGVEVKKRPVIVQGDDPEKKKAEEKTQEEIKKAEEVHDQQIADAEKKAADEEQSVVQQEQQQTQSVEGDVDKTNEYLKDVSNQIGGKT